LSKIVDFEQTINKYWIAREQESRTKTVFRIAQESSERLRQRITTSDLGQARGQVESRIKGELATSLNYADAAKNMSAAEKQARDAEALVQTQLKQIYMVSQTAMEPSKRDRTVAVAPADELHTRFKGAQARHPLVINRIKGPINDLLTLYQRAHDVFQADFEKLKKALQRLDDNSGAYFEAKAEDRDISAKREKLKKIEVLIQFLERAAQLMAERGLDTEVKFSKALSEVISEPYASWKTASEELLPAKVRAEAEIARMF
jgi:hypothetical protein